MIRWRIVGGALVLSAVIWWFAPESPEVVAANVPPRTVPAIEADISARFQPIPALDAKTESFDGPVRKLFGERQGALPPPAVVAPSVPAPALPNTFQLLGKAQIDGAWKAIITVDGKSYLAGTGEKVADRFVVEKLSPPSLVVVDLDQGGTRFNLSVGEIQ